MVFDHLAARQLTQERQSGIPPARVVIDKYVISAVEKVLNFLGMRYRITVKVVRLGKNAHLAFLLL